MGFNDNNFPMFSPLEKIKNFFSTSRKLNAQTWEKFEEILYEADFGVHSTEKLIFKVREDLSKKHELTLQELEQHLKDFLSPLLTSLEKKIEIHTTPFVIMVVGVNGVGKTTTVAKSAHYFKKGGKEVLMVAADTFRAASCDQLEVWGERLGIEVFSNEGDPSSVVFDGLGKAVKRNNTVVLIDTAGRMHTRQPLMEELKKMKRVIQKVIPSAPHEIWGVIDANTGHNALNQFVKFHEAVGLTGIILTKMDGTAKGGMLISLGQDFGIPIVFLGTGECEDDLLPFSSTDFLNRLTSSF